MSDSLDPDQMPHSAASDLGLHCLLKPVCPNTWDYYGTPSFWTSLNFFNTIIVLKFQHQFY